MRNSYIVATRNRLEFLPRALENWRHLKDARDEIIVIDGGSTDGTRELLTSAGKPVVDILISEPDQSEAHALNKGMLAASGRYIKFLTDDDVFFRDGIDAACSALDSEPTMDMLYTGGEFADATGALELLTLPDLTNPYWRVWMCGLGVVIRRQSLSLIGLLDPRHKRADMSLNVQAMVRGAKAGFLSVRTFRHNLHRGSISSQLGVGGRFSGFVLDGQRIFCDLNAPTELRMTRGIPWRLYRRAKSVFSHGRQVARGGQRVFSGKLHFETAEPALASG